MKFIILIAIIFFSGLHHRARGILVPQSGIKPVLPAVEAYSLNQWSAREVPLSFSTKEIQTETPWGLD